MSRKRILTTVEYELREIDEHGDVIDVEHFPENQKDEAMHKGKLSQAIACVVEKHVKRFPAHLAAEPDVFTFVAAYGDQNALKAGGWLT